MAHCGWWGFSFFPSFSNGGGGVLQNLMLEGDRKAPFTSPISYLRQSHSTEPGSEPGTERGAEWRGRLVGGNQVLATFARQATPTFNLTCLESGRAESRELARSLARSPARSHRPRLPGTMWSRAWTLPFPFMCLRAGADVGFAELELCICMIGWMEKKPEKAARPVFKGYSLSVGGSPPPERRYTQRGMHSRRNKTAVALFSRTIESYAATSHRGPYRRRTAWRISLAARLRELFIFIASGNLTNQSCDGNIILLTGGKQSAFNGLEDVFKRFFLLIFLPRPSPPVACCYESHSCILRNQSLFFFF